MNTSANENAIRNLTKYGTSLVGMKAQSTLLTMIGANGGKAFEPAQEITGFSIQGEGSEDPLLMVKIGGEEVLEQTLFNIH